MGFKREMFGCLAGEDPLPPPQGRALIFGV